MSGVIVDGFEVVDVDEGDGQVLAEASCPFEFSVEFLLYAAAV
jgi:hypothetical protein